MEIAVVYHPPVLGLTGEAGGLRPVFLRGLILGLGEQVGELPGEIVQVPDVQPRQCCHEDDQPDGNIQPFHFPASFLGTQ